MSSVSDALIAKAHQAFDVTDDLGRTLTLRRPGVMDALALNDALRDNAGNRLYMGMAAPVSWLAAVDGETVAAPATKAAFEAVVDRLGDEGFTAIIDGLTGRGETLDEEAFWTQVRSIAEHPAIREALWLVKNGVPFETAFRMDEIERVAWCITFGEFEGGTFDWGARAWEEKDHDR